MNETISRNDQVPVIRDVDVLVAGCGVSGIFAALSAARAGARVFVVDRLHAPGGNIGPGMLVGAWVAQGWKSFILKDGRYPPGIVQDFIDRVDKHLDDVPYTYPAMSHAVSRVTFEMFDEFNVELMLDGFVAGPIMEGTRIHGLFVETKSGTVAIRAKVVIDATGDADVARRAGALCRTCSPFGTVYRADAATSDKRITGRNPTLRGYNETALLFYVADADYWKFRAFLMCPCELSDDDKAWADAHFLIQDQVWPDSLIPILRRGWESGEFQIEREIRPGVRAAFNNWFSDDISRPGLLGGRAGIFGDYDTGSWEDVSMAEREVRSLIHDGVNFFRRQQVPGFEKGYLLFISPFMGARGGTFIEGETTMPSSGQKIDEPRADAMYRSFMYGMPDIGDVAPPEGYDVPYGMLLPKNVEGLLVTGRGASWERRGHDPAFRERSNMMALGEATGRAAAIAAADDVSPRNIEVRKLQQAMLESGYYLGDEARLTALGLGHATGKEGSA